MATFADLSTFFSHLLEEFSLTPSTTKGAFLSTVTQGKKEKVLIYPEELCKETGLSPEQLMQRLNRLRSLHPGIQRQGWDFTYRDSAS